MFVEAGDVQPRSLASAFLRPVADEAVMSASVKAMEYMAESFDRAYGPQSDARIVLNVEAREGIAADRAEEVVQFVAQRWTTWA